MTESAGSPDIPENPGSAEPPAGSPGPDDNVAEAGTTGERDGDGRVGPSVPEPEPAVAEGAPSGTAKGSPSAPGPSAERDGTPESGGTPDEDGSDEAEGAAAAGTGTSLGGTASRRRRGRRRWLRWTAIGVSCVVLGTASAGWWFYQHLNGNITADTETASQLQTYEKERPTPVALDALNILLIGSDTRSGPGDDKDGGGGDGTARSDTTILLHLAADRKSATAVSIPRDLMVHIPSCGKPDGTHTQAQFAQFNWAYSFGGTACTTRTVENLTGVRIDHEMVIDFNGFKNMVDAVGGVDVCLKQPVDDQDAHLKLPAGRQTLNGTQALGFVRARHAIGDGSDTERIGRQQAFLGSLFSKMQSDGVLLNPTKLYPVLNAATKAITTDPGLASLRDLYNLVHSLKSVPTSDVRFLTVPEEPYVPDPNRDQLVEPAADKLFQQLRDDAPVSVRPKDAPDPSASGSAADPGSSATPSGSPGGSGSDRPPASGDPSATATPDAPASGSTSPSPAPTFTGTNAAVSQCS